MLGELTFDGLAAVVTGAAAGTGRATVASYMSGAVIPVDGGQTAS